MLLADRNRLVTAGIAVAETTFPASLTIAGTDYAAATTKLAKDQILVVGGFDASRRISFRVARAAFTAAAKPIPKSGDPIVCTAPADLAATYRLDGVRVDPSGLAVMLDCIAPAQ